MKYAFRELEKNHRMVQNYAVVPDDSQKVKVLLTSG